MKRNCYETEKGLAVHSDDYLLSVAIAGDHSAFIELSRRHTPMVLHVLTRITKNQDDVEEAMQETLMKAFSHLKTFEGRSSFSTWLTRIGINSALMARRRERKHREVPLDANLEIEKGCSMLYADLAPNPENLVCLQPWL